MSIGRMNFFKINIAFFLILIPLFNYAQSNVDSLIAIHKNETLQDTTRFNALEKFLTREYIKSNDDSVFYYTEILHDLAKKLNSEKYRGIAFQKKGLAFYFDKEYDKSILYYDSAIQMAGAVKDTTTIIKSYHALGKVATDGEKDYDLPLKYYNTALELSKQSKDSVSIGNSLYFIGQYLRDNNYFGEAINYHIRELEIWKKLNDQNRIMLSYDLIALNHESLTDYKQAIQYYMEEFKVSEESGDTRNMTNVYEKIAIIYQIQEQYDKALEYALKVLDIREQLNIKSRLHDSYNNIGAIYLDTEDLKKAEEYYNKSLVLRKELNNPHYIAMSYSNIGILKEKMEQYDSALYYNNKALKIRMELGDQRYITSTLKNIGSVYYKKKNYKEAIKYSKRVLKYAQEKSKLIFIKEAALILSNSYAQTRDYKSALEMYKLHINNRDSVVNEQNQQDVLLLDYKYTYEKKALADSLRSAELLKRNESELKLEVLQSERIQREAYYLYFILLIIIILLVALGNRFRLIRKQKKIIEEQKAKVDTINAELLETNDEVQTQAAALHEVNQEIILINENLEQTVKARTEKIELQNSKLRSYAFSNSHQVRAPIARLLGLVNLWNHEGIKPEEQAFLMEKISEAAFELDKIVLEITKKLEKTDSEI